MNRGIISTRYAKALLSSAIEEGTENEVCKQVQILSESFREVPGLQNSLCNPIISTENKASLIRSASGGIISKEFEQFINLVLDNKREYLLHSMALMYMHLFHRNKNISVCSLITAVPVSEEVEERIKQLITAKTHGPAVLRKTVNPDILGGFIFELNYNRLDASISNQLKRIRKQFLSANNQ